VGVRVLYTLLSSSLLIEGRSDAAPNCCVGPPVTGDNRGQPGGRAVTWASLIACLAVHSCTSVHAARALCWAARGLLRLSRCVSAATATLTDDCQDGSPVGLGQRRPAVGVPSARRTPLPQPPAEPSARVPGREPGRHRVLACHCVPLSATPVVNPALGPRCLSHRPGRSSTSLPTAAGRLGAVQRSQPPSWSTGRFRPRRPVLQLRRILRHLRRILRRPLQKHAFFPMILVTVRVP